jgi:hypothetical protein
MFRPCGLLTLVLAGCPKTDDSDPPDTEDTADTDTDTGPVDTTAPSVLSTTPAGGPEPLGRDTAVSFTFSESMEPSSATFTWSHDGGVVPFDVVWSDGDTIATLEPVAPLAGLRSHTATVAASTSDVAGNPLGADTSVSFTTLEPTWERRDVGGGAEVIPLDAAFDADGNAILTLRILDGSPIDAGGWIPYDAETGAFGAPVLPPKAEACGVAFHDPDFLVVCSSFEALTATRTRYESGGGWTVDAPVVYEGNHGDAVQVIPVEGTYDFAWFAQRSASSGVLWGGFVGETAPPPSYVLTSVGDFIAFQHPNGGAAVLATDGEPVFGGTRVDLWTGDGDSSSHARIENRTDAGARRLLGVGDLGSQAVLAWSYGGGATATVYRYLIDEAAASIRGAQADDSERARFAVTGDGTSGALFSSGGEVRFQFDDGAAGFVEEVVDATYGEVVALVAGQARFLAVYRRSNTANRGRLETFELVARVRAPNGTWSEPEILANGPDVGGATAAARDFSFTVLFEEAGELQRARYNTSDGWADPVRLDAAARGWSGALAHRGTDGFLEAWGEDGDLVAAFAGSAVRAEAPAEGSVTASKWVGDPRGDGVLVFSQHLGHGVGLFAARRTAAGWREPVRLDVAAQGVFDIAASAHDGDVAVAWVRPDDRTAWFAELPSNDAPNPTLLAEDVVVPMDDYDTLGGIALAPTETGHVAVVAIEQLVCTVCRAGRDDPRVSLMAYAIEGGVVGDGTVAFDLGTDGDVYGLSLAASDVGVFGFASVNTTTETVIGLRTEGGVLVGEDLEVAPSVEGRPSVRAVGGVAGDLLGLRRAARRGADATEVWHRAVEAGGFAPPVTVDDLDANYTGWWDAARAEDGALHVITTSKGGTVRTAHHTVGGWSAATVLGEGGTLIPAVAAAPGGRVVAWRALDGLHVEGPLGSVVHEMEAPVLASAPILVDGGRVTVGWEAFTDAAHPGALDATGAWRDLPAVTTYALLPLGAWSDDSGVGVVASSEQLIDPSYLVSLESF